MTAIKIPVRVIGTNTKRRDPIPRSEAGPRPHTGRRPEAEPELPASRAATQSGDPVRPASVETSEECECAPVDRAVLARGAARRPLATHEVTATREVDTAQDRLLIEVLSIADNLERALAVAHEDSPIRQGVAITHRDVLRLLRRHGLEQIEAHEQPFDPHWHEAVDVVPAQELGVDPGTVVRVMVPGYRRGEQLFRPARVVVAQ
jgi:hypothetical protein